MAKDIETWPRQIKAYDELPEDYQHFFQDIKEPSVPFPYTLFIPAMRWIKRFCKEKLLCLTGIGISIYEKDAGTIRKEEFAFESICYIEEGTVLLHSWITLYGNVKGKSRIAKIEFNTVTKDLFHQIILELRKRVLEYSRKEKTIIDAKLIQLKEKSYKFMNYGINSLLPGEEVVELFFQPGVYEKYHYFFQRIKSPAQLHLLTEEEYILIKEEEGKKNDKSQYSGIWIYVPLVKLQHIEMVSTQDPTLLALTLSIKGGNKIKAALVSETEKELESYLQRVRQLLVKEDVSTDID